MLCREEVRREGSFAKQDKDRQSTRAVTFLRGVNEEAFGFCLCYSRETQVCDEPQFLLLLLL